jgi:hypothetical protein
MVILYLLHHFCRSASSQITVKMREECSVMPPNYCFGTNSPSDSRALGTTFVKWNVAL